MNLRSMLSVSVASQVGTLQGKLETEVTVALTRLIDRFSQKCPTADEFQTLTATIDNIDNYTNQVARRVEALNRVAIRLGPVIRNLTRVVQTLRTLPVPTAVAGVGVPIGLTNRYAQLLINLSTYLDRLKADQSTIQQLTGQLTLRSTRVQDLRNTLAEVLAPCIEENEEFLKALRRSQEQVSSLGPDRSYRAANGKDYFFEIVEEVGGPGPVPRRFAVAKDRTGVIVMRGAPSFSSSTKVLIDEVKLRIDRQLP